MSLNFNLKAIIKATPDQIYKAWLDSNLHEKMIEGESCVCNHKIGAKHKAHGDYIWAKI